MNEVEKVEFQLLLDAIYYRYGYDFRSYCKASLLRRLCLFSKRYSVQHLSEFIPRLLRDSAFFHELLKHLLVSVTEWFRDPQFFAKVLQKVFPLLHTYPFIKIWHAGCASGEEIYTMAILLKESGLSKKVILYGTDINQESLKSARDGIFRLEELEKAQVRYKIAGGQSQLLDHFTVKYGYAKIQESLKENIVFSTHNLECDRVFGDMNMILCRNVFIYFTRELQHRVLSLFMESLVTRGFLCLGPKETINFYENKNSLEVFAEEDKIYRKKL